jgi:SH3 domain protein
VLFAVFLYLFSRKRVLRGCSNKAERPAAQSRAVRDGTLSSKMMDTPLKALLILALLGTVLSSPSYGESLYVIDSLTITVRRGPSTEHKVIGTLKTGEQVDLKELSGDWALVRHSGDQEGWVVARFLSEEPPSFLLVQKLQTEKKTNAELIDTLKKKNRALKRENETLSAQLSTITTKFDELKQGAQGYLSLKEEHESAREKIQALISSNEKLILENKVLKDVTKIKWFLIGAGVMSGGWLIGFIMGRSKRKKKSGLTFSLKE